MSAILGFKGTKDELRSKLEAAFYNTYHPSLQSSADGWPNLEGYVREFLRAYAFELAKTITNELYTNDDFEKDIGLTNGK